MGFTQKLFANPDFGWSNKLRLPEYRQVELYTKRKALSFEDAALPDDVPMERIAASVRAALVFEAALAGVHPTQHPLTAWARCKEMPKTTQTEKVLAELHRITRTLRKIAFHSHGHVDLRDGIICLGGAIDGVALTLEITAAGLDLIETMAAYWFSAKNSIYPEAYVEWLFSEMFCDLVGEIKRFSDEDRILYQFRRRPPFNRHFRFDCDNPKATFEADHVRFEIGERFSDPARYAIDFYVVFSDVLHIIPVEALKDGRIPRPDLPKWEARTPDALSLPAAFRTRFAREKIVVGQPMT
jgi:hypothetical protein